MKSVYMLMHQHKPNAAELIRQVAEAFDQAGISVAAEPWVRALMNGQDVPQLSGLPLEACDAVVAVGGDGTLLRANTLAIPHALPVLGVNVGRVGFLAELELEQVAAAAKLLAKDTYSVEERMMLKAIVGACEMYALNDVVVSRGGYSRLIGINAWVGNDQIGRFIADGVIVSTPTGSTGYSLSAGGPIVCPEVECMLLTPICAHSLQHRPVVTSARQTISVQLDRDHTAMISVDGQAPFHFGSGETLTITRAETRARFIRFEPKSFFSMIRVKLSEWSC